MYNKNLYVLLNFAFVNDNFKVLWLIKWAFIISLKSKIVLNVFNFFCPFLSHFKLLFTHKLFIISSTHSIFPNLCCNRFTKLLPQNDVNNVTKIVGQWMTVVFALFTGHENDATQLRDVYYWRIRPLIKERWKRSKICFDLSLNDFFDSVNPKRNKNEIAV